MLSESFSVVWISEVVHCGLMSENIVLTPMAIAES